MRRDEIHQVLREEMATAREESKIASELFDALVSDVPSGVPYPDNVHRIRLASIEYAIARTRLLAAMSRLNAFVIHGRVPRELEEFGGNPEA